MSVTNSGSFFKPLTDFQNVTNVFMQGLTVYRGLRMNLPSQAEVGLIFLCIDSLEAFAGTGISVQKFNCDVSRALRGGNSDLHF